jgi:hypothetical protein
MGRDRRSAQACARWDPGGVQATELRCGERIPAATGGADEALDGLSVDGVHLDSGLLGTCMLSAGGWGHSALESDASGRRGLMAPLW